MQAGEVRRLPDEWERLDDQLRAMEVRIDSLVERLLAIQARLSGPAPWQRHLPLVIPDDPDRQGEA
jgi:hypothetical protein